MASHQIYRLLESERFWKPAFLVTVLVYGAVLGFGFLKTSEPFLIQTSALDGAATEALSDGTGRMEIDLIAAPAKTSAATPAEAPVLSEELSVLPVATVPPVVPAPIPLPVKADFPVPETPVSPVPETPVPVVPIAPVPVPATPVRKEPVPEKTSPVPQTKTPQRAGAPAGPSAVSASRLGAAAGNAAPVSGAPGGGLASGNVAVGSRDFPQAPYPESARERGFQGTVRVNIQVKDGVIQDVTVVNSSGYVVLDIHTIRWIKARWRFPKQITREYKAMAITFRLTE